MCAAKTYGIDLGSAGPHMEQSLLCVEPCHDFGPHGYGRLARLNADFVAMTRATGMGSGASGGPSGGGKDDFERSLEEAVDWAVLLVLGYLGNKHSGGQEAPGSAQGGPPTGFSVPNTQSFSQSFSQSLSQSLSQDPAFVSGDGPEPADGGECRRNAVHVCKVLDQLAADWPMIELMRPTEGGGASPDEDALIAYRSAAVAAGGLTPRVLFAAIKEAYGAMLGTPGRAGDCGVDVLADEELTQYVGRRLVTVMDSSHRLCRPTMNAVGRREMAVDPVGFSEFLTRTCGLPSQRGGMLGEDDDGEKEEEEERAADAAAMEQGAEGEERVRAFQERRDKGKKARNEDGAGESGPPAAAGGQDFTRVATRSSIAIGLAQEIVFVLQEEEGTTSPEGAASLVQGAGSRARSMLKGDAPMGAPQGASAAAAAVPMRSSEPDPVQEEIAGLIAGACRVAGSSVDDAVSFLDNLMAGALGDGPLGDGILRGCVSSILLESVEGDRSLSPSSGESAMAGGGPRMQAGGAPPSVRAALEDIALRDYEGYGNLVFTAFLRGVGEVGGDGDLRAKVSRAIQDALGDNEAGDPDPREIALVRGQLLGALRSVFYMKLSLMTLVYRAYCGEVNTDPRDIVGTSLREFDCASHAPPAPLGADAPPDLGGVTDPLSFVGSCAGLWDWCVSAARTEPTEFVRSLYEWVNGSDALPPTGERRDDWVAWGGVLGEFATALEHKFSDINIRPAQYLRGLLAYGTRTKTCRVSPDSERVGEALSEFVLQTGRNISKRIPRSLTTANFAVARRAAKMVPDFQNMTNELLVAICDDGRARYDGAAAADAAAAGTRLDELYDGMARAVAAVADRERGALANVEPKIMQAFDEQFGAGGPPAAVPAAIRATPKAWVTWDELEQFAAGAGAAAQPSIAQFADMLTYISRESTRGGPPAGGEPLVLLDNNAVNMNAPPGAADARDLIDSLISRPNIANWCMLMVVLDAMGVFGTCPKGHDSDYYVQGPVHIFLRAGNGFEFSLEVTARGAGDYSWGVTYYLKCGNGTTYSGYFDAKVGTSALTTLSAANTYKNAIQVLAAQVRLEQLSGNLDTAPAMQAVLANAAVRRAVAEALFPKALGDFGQECTLIAVNNGFDHVDGAGAGADPPANAAARMLKGWQYGGGQAGGALDDKQSIEALWGACPCAVMADGDRPSFERIAMMILLGRSIAGDDYYRNSLNPKAQAFYPTRGRDPRIYLVNKGVPETLIPPARLTGGVTPARTGLLLDRDIVAPMVVAAQGGGRRMSRKNRRRRRPKRTRRASKAAKQRSKAKRAPKKARRSKRK